jgi:hypothetical protein
VSLARLQQGSRANSSACGSADVLEALGVNIDLGPEVLPCESCTTKSAGCDSCWWNTRDASGPTPCLHP